MNIDSEKLSKLISRARLNAETKSKRLMATDINSANNLLSEALAYARVERHLARLEVRELKKMIKAKQEELNGVKLYLIPIAPLDIPEIGSSR